jgi:glycosyltransferase involved in cell wall biosynthesis
MLGAIVWLRKHRPELGVVVELDDDLAAIPIGNQAYSHIHPSCNRSENFSWLRQAIQNATGLTVSTPELGRLYATRNVIDTTFVIRNAVPASMLEQSSRAIDRRAAERDHDRVVGWAGFAGTHPGDLNVMSGALADVVGADRTDGRRVRFRNVGPRDGLSDALNLREDDIEATGWLKPNMYRVAMGELDVGLVPLADTRFNRGKSALKVIEMAAAGVPVIASDAPEHRELQRAGMPLWVVKNRRRDWVRALRSILDLESDELRELAVTHRDFIAQNHTVEKRANEWINAWKKSIPHNNSS